MEGVILSTPNNSGFRTQLKNAASMLCARTLPKQRRNEHTTCSKSRHHTYPRATQPKRAAISCRMEPLMCDQQPPATLDQPCEVNDLNKNTKPNGVVMCKGTLAREVANVWECHVGPPREPAPADRVQSIFNEIELYPTKSQVFEMLACARQCARRKSLTLTFGEFCVFAAELRRCSRQARQTPSKSESPLWTVDRGDLRDKATCKQVNGSEAPPPPCEVFLGGSCNPTTWRSDIAIPLLEKMGITYFNPQVDDWSKELMEVEYKAKADARALLFVLDSETRAIGASVEAAHLAASPRDLLLVLRPYSRHQTIGDETISDQEYIELSRARATLQEAVERRGLPAFTDIPSALRCARAVIRGARTHPRHSLRHTILRLKRAYDSAGGKNARLPRPKAVDTLKDVARVQREVADRFLPQSVETVDFETFCAAVAELTSDTENQGRVTEPASQAVASAGAGATRLADATNGLRAYNARLRAYGRKLGLYIPKNGGSRNCGEESASAGSASSGESVFTPGTERRLDQLPAMLGAPTHDVYLAGAFPTNETRPEEVLRRENFTYVVPRANDYTRMFSCPARRAAPAHPESPRTDKKPRPSASTDDKLRCTSTSEEDVQLRSRSTSMEPVDRLSASDFYTVTENQTPQPFKGTYDEDLLLGSRVLVFSLSSEAPCLAAMVLAAHYMGLRPSNTVLLVQSMDPAASNNLQYSEAAVKDYNRGRHYLADLARRTGVPVFENVDDAMQCVVARLRSTL